LKVDLKVLVLTVAFNKGTLFYYEAHSKKDWHGGQWKVTVTIYWVTFVVFTQELEMISARDVLKYSLSITTKFEYLKTVMTI
jgi:hypothetical protein